MKRRIFGLENEYGLTCTLNGQRRLSPDNVARYLFDATARGGGGGVRVAPATPGDCGLMRHVAAVLALLPRRSARSARSWRPSAC
jgi:hypothetical protein